VKSAALTHDIIGAAMEVHTLLGPGFLEAIYKNALLHELQLHGLDVTTELEVPVTYKNQIVGTHRLDIVVEGKVTRTESRERNQRVSRRSNSLVLNGHTY